MEVDGIQEPGDPDKPSDRRSGVPQPDRRRLLAGALGGALVVGGATGAGVAAATNGVGWRREAVTVDVACLGETWRDTVPRNPADAADARLPFLVEGAIYPAGTVSDGFVPTDDGVIGRWFCQGWLVIDGSRAEPHAASRQTFVLGLIAEDNLFPETTLITQGMEGTLNQEIISTRAVCGGTGDYLAAVGACRQINRGLNTTVLNDGFDDQAPNFRMEFDLVLPSL